MGTNLLHQILGRTGCFTEIIKMTFKQNLLASTILTVILFVIYCFGYVSGFVPKADIIPLVNHFVATLLTIYGVTKGSALIHPNSDSSQED
jgi:hypothetical protein